MGEIVVWEPAGCMVNVYALEILSLMGEVLVPMSAPYLKVIVALVTPGAVALYTIPEKFGLSINDCSPCLRVTCCALHGGPAIFIKA